jgi:hypothetical protein
MLRVSPDSRVIKTCLSRRQRHQHQQGHFSTKPHFGQLALMQTFTILHYIWSILSLIKTIMLYVSAVRLWRYVIKTCLAVAHEPVVNMQRNDALWAQGLREERGAHGRVHASAHQHQDL